MKLIALRGKYGKEQFAMVDNEDFEYLNQFKWRLGKTRYPRRTFNFPHSRKTTTIFMHKEVNKTPTGMTTDHINRNRLDNRRENLRSCSVENNLQNKGISKVNKSGFKGVCWSKSMKMWRAYIWKGKSYHLGFYDTPEEAALIYDATAYMLFGDYANYNIAERGIICGK